MWHLGGSPRARASWSTRERITWLLPDGGRHAGTSGAKPRSSCASAISKAPISETRLTGARARVELGDAETAVEQLKLVADDLQEKGKDADSLKLLTEAAQIDPEDTELRRSLVQAYVARGDFEAASQFATSAADLKGSRTSCSGRGGR